MKERFMAAGFEMDRTGWHMIGNPVENHFQIRVPEADAELLAARLECAAKAIRRMLSRDTTSSGNK